MPSIAVIVIAVPVLAFITVALLAVAFVSPGRSDLQNRLRAYGYDVKTLSGSDLNEPFSARVIAPVGRALAALVRSFTPDSMRQNAVARLAEAGNPVRLGTFLTVRVVLMIALPVLVLLPRILARDVGLLHLIIAVVVGYIGNRLPDIWLSFRIDARRDQIRKALPDALDLIVVCVEAGYGLEGALNKVTERTTGPLSDELKRTLGEIRLGKARREALRDLSDRVGVADLQSFIAAIVQADQMGVSIAQVLRVQADAARVRRRQRAEEKALQAPIKMLFPLFLLIFPTLMMVILAPAAVKMVGFFGMMTGR